MRLVNWRALVVGAAGFGLAACGDDVTVTPPAPNITVNPQSVTCNTGQTTAVGVTVTGGSNTSVAFTGGTGVTVTPSGASGATVLCGNTPGAAVITVTVTSNGQQFTSSIPVTIVQAPTQANVIAIQVSPTSASLTPGGTLTIVPSITLANGAPANTSTDVTYTSSSTAVTVTRNTNNTATVTVLPTATAGTQAVITATPNANTNIRASTVVTVVGTNTLVTGLSVSPTSVNLNVGGTQQIVANVALAAGAPAGTSTNVTCASSNTQVITVNNTAAPGGTSCTVTAVGNGTATVTIASVAAPGVTQLVGVNVTSPAPVRLTIQNVEVVGPAGTRIPADQTNVGGNLFLTLNLDPGDNRPDSVVVTIGGQRVNCQTFTAQFVQALRASLISGAADVQPIACQLNTSQFNSTTGAPLVVNGKQQLSATVFFRPGTAGAGSNTTQTATIPLELTINNQSGFFVNVSNAPSATQAAINATGQAVGPQGVTWRAGAITVSVLPVNFAPGGQSGPGSPSFGPTTVALVDCPFNAVGVCNSFRLVAQQTTAQATGSNAGSVTFAGDVGCFWDANFGGVTGYQQLFQSSGTGAGGTGASGAFCAGFGGGNTSGFTGDPTTNTLVGYTTPNAGRTVNGASNIPANAQAATFVVVGSTTPTFGTAGTVILAANGQPLSANLPANQGGGIVGGNVAAALYIDNQAPEPVAQANFPSSNFAISVDANSSANLVFGFFNSNQPFTSAAFQFAYFDPITGLLTTTNPDWGGVDRVTEAFFAQSFAGGSANQTSGNPSTFVGTATRVTSAAQLAALPPLGSTNFYRLAFQETDALGNRRNQFVNQIFQPGTATAALVQTRFNVDVSAPTLQLLTASNPAGCILDPTTVGVCQQRVGPANTVFGPAAVRVGFQTISNIAIAPQIAFQASDDVGFGPTPLSATIARYRRAGTTATVECLSSVAADGTPTFIAIGDGNGSNGSNGTTCTPVLIPLSPINLPTAGAAAWALYSGSVQARDQAGNLSTPITFNFVVDQPPPTNISVSLPQTLNGGQAVTFTAGASDNLAVRSGAPRVGYPNLPNPLIYPETSVLSLATIFASLSPLGTSALPTQNQASMTLTIPNFIRTITTVSGTFQPASYATANTLQAQIFDLASNSALSTVLPIPAANIPSVPAASPYIQAANQVNNVFTFSLAVAPGTPTIPPAVNTFDATICGPVNAGSACPGTATFSVVQQGAANTYISQFARIELWVFDPIAGGFRFLASVPSGFVTDNPGEQRRVTSNVTLPANTQPFFLAPPATTAPISYQIIAIGVNGTGDALVSNPVSVTINP